MREKIARAVAKSLEKENPSLEVVDDECGIDVCDDYDNKSYDMLQVADAVLDALMEPTEGMMNATCDNVMFYGHGGMQPARRDEFVASIKAAKDGK